MQATRKSAYRAARTLLHAFSSLRTKPRMEITFSYRHDLTDIPSVECPAGGEIKQLYAGDMPLLHKVWPVPLDKMYRRLERGDRCYALFIDRRIAHYQWIQTSGWHYVRPAGRWMRVLKKEFVDYHVRVADWSRGRRIDQYVKSYILQQYKLEGYRHGWVYTTASNIASQKGIERAGWVFDEGYRSLVFGTIHIPLPGTLKAKPSLAANEHG